MWFLFAQRARDNPLMALNPSFDPVEFPNPVAVGNRFEFNLAKMAKAIVIEVSGSRKYWLTSIDNLRSTESTLSMPLLFGQKIESNGCVRSRY
jgi:acyl dehydratase